MYIMLHQENMKRQYLHFLLLEDLYQRKATSQGKGITFQIQSHLSQFLKTEEFIL